MEGTASNYRSRGGGRCSDKTRHVWSPREEEVLVSSLRDLIADGWKTENGFRVGYLGKLETAIRKVFPGTDLKVQPHINSKMTGWKRLYEIALGAMMQTGVGYNETSGLLECTDKQWAMVVKGDPLATNMRHRLFPMYRIWEELFGKDRATCETAEDVMDAVNDLINEDNTNKEKSATGNGKGKSDDANLEDAYQVDLDGVFEEEGNSVCQNPTSAPQPKASGIKRKNPDNFEGLFNVVTQICHNTEENMAKLAKFVGYKHGLGEKKARLFELVGKIPGLSVDEQLDVSEILVKEVDLLEMFIRLPEAMRARYVHRLLEKQKKAD